MTRLTRSADLTKEALFAQQRSLMPNSKIALLDGELMHRDKPPDTAALVKDFYERVEHINSMTATAERAFSMFGIPSHMTIPRPCVMSQTGCTLRVDGRESVFTLSYFFHSGVVAAVDSLDDAFVATAQVGQAVRDIELDIMKGPVVSATPSPGGSRSSGPTQPEQQLPGRQQHQPTQQSTHQQHTHQSNSQADNQPPVQHPTASSAQLVHHPSLNEKALMDQQFTIYCTTEREKGRPKFPNTAIPVMPSSNPTENMHRFWQTVATVDSKPDSAARPFFVGIVAPYAVGERRSWYDMRYFPATRLWAAIDQDDHTSIATAVVPEGVSNPPQT